MIEQITRRINSNVYGYDGDREETINMNFAHYSPKDQIAKLVDDTPNTQRLLRHQQNQYRLPRNPSLTQRDPHELRRIHPYKKEKINGLSSALDGAITHLFHTFTNIPVNECTLGVHEIELVVYHTCQNIQRRLWKGDLPSRLQAAEIAVVLETNN